MTVKGCPSRETLNVHGSVDDPDAVLFALGDGHLGIFAATAWAFVGTVDENVVRERWANLRVLSDLIKCESRGVVVICDGKDTKVLVVVCCGRSIDDHCSKHTITILSRPVRVVPGRSELCSLETVLASLSRGNRALCDARYAVVLTAVELTDTVPVNACAIVFHAVLDIDDNCITPFCSDGWARILTIYQLKLSATR
jgi:hypothetical protein